MAVAKFPRSHSENQFLRHLPLHWNSIMLPPHCGQIRLMIDEMMREASQNSAWLISNSFLKFTVATTARPVAVNCKPKTNFQAASYGKKHAISRELQLHCRYRRQAFGM